MLIQIAIVIAVIIGILFLIRRIGAWLLRIDDIITALKDIKEVIALLRGVLHELKVLNGVYEASEDV